MEEIDHGEKEEKKQMNLLVIAVLPCRTYTRMEDFFLKSGFISVKISGRKVLLLMQQEPACNIYLKIQSLMNYFAIKNGLTFHPEKPLRKSECPSEKNMKMKRTVKQVYIQLQNQNMKSKKNNVFSLTR